ncbi:MAG: hypothetical protein ACP5P9_09930 [Acidimicrobiales bacterium]
MGNERRVIGILLVGLVVVVAGAAAAVGVSMSHPGPPAAFLSAARATEDASSFSGTLRVTTERTSSPAANRSEVTVVSQAPGSPAPRSVTQYFEAMLHASGVQETGHSGTYHFTAPASDFVQPGLPAYTFQQFDAHVSVTVRGGVVRSMTVVVAANPSVQIQYLVLDQVSA